MPRVYQAILALQLPQLCYLYLMVDSLQRGWGFLLLKQPPTRGPKHLYSKTKGFHCWRVPCIGDIEDIATIGQKSCCGRLLLWKYIAAELYIIIQLSDFFNLIYSTEMVAMVLNIYARIYNYIYMEIRWTCEMLGDLPLVEFPFHQL